MSFFANFDTIIDVDLDVKVGPNHEVLDILLGQKSIKKHLLADDLEIIQDIITEENVAEGDFKLPDMNFEVSVSADILSGRPATRVDPADPNEVVSLQVDYGDIDLRPYLPSHVIESLEDRALEEASED